MSNTKHAPGPWEVGRTVVRDVSKGHTIVSFVNRKGVDYLNAESNAKLIAAAPELLEVVTTLYVTMKNNGFNGGHWKKYLEQMESAIKKATT